MNSPLTAAPALLSMPPAPGPELPPHLRMIPVLYEPVSLPETAYYTPRCARCGTVRQDLARVYGQLVCADPAVCRG